MAIIPDYDFSKKKKKFFFFHHISKGDYWGDDNSLNWIIDFVELWSAPVVKKFTPSPKAKHAGWYAWQNHDRIMTESFP